MVGRRHSSPPLVMASALVSRLRGLPKDTHNFFTHTIWKGELLEDRSARGHWYGLLRMLSITYQGVLDNNLFSRAAALSYYSLIGMGPLVAIVVMVSGFLIKGENSDLAVNALNKLVLFIAPPVAEYSRMESSSPVSKHPSLPAASKAQSPGDPSSAKPSPAAGTGRNLSAGANAAEETAETRLNSDLVRLIDRMIESARSKTVGVFGVLVLIFIGIQLLTSVETTFNDIWGARRGRPWVQRVVFYWTFISLGALLGLGSIGFLSASTVVDWLSVMPLGSVMAPLVNFLLPVVTFVILVGMLLAVYQFFPNTAVRWKAALTGATVVAILLLLNNYLSIIYVQRVIQSRSLYGTVGIIPVLMLGLYIFWFFVLFGSQVVYSVQNVNFLTNQLAWNNASTRTRETISIASFLLVCRRFQECGRPYSADELSNRIRVPVNLLNECLTRLCDAGFLTTTRHREENKRTEIIRYQPTRPLNKMTLAEVRTGLDEFGSNQGDKMIQRADPLLHWYHERLEAVHSTQLGSRSVEDLLAGQTP